ncbi:NmrA family NAD(P)-binding protein [Actinospica sp.]|uniref:NmrA family NAD(P)-binding protein n=1 Tax=Actinospica sp. TaxID=1872142 RepID=UPI002BAB49BB|nr:NmrA family NAD(P)-binding protein [Actinospica sp.]HWG28572.1 NmrA family NAD(P)-binding protein [Actinospica sp.]
MILITTAGKVGSAAALLLAQREVPVKILVRDPAASAGLARAGVEVIAGDLRIPASIDAAMRGVAGVVLVSPAVPAEELNVIDSAVRAGVNHVVKVTSKSSLDSPIVRRRGQAQIENALIACGLGYTLLRNNAYMQNFFMLAPAIAATGGFGASAGDGRIGMIDTRDVADVAAWIAVAPEPHAGKTYWPTGPEVVSYADAAAVLSEALGRPVAYRQLTFEQQKQAMVNAGLPINVAEDNARALGLFADGDADYTTDDVPTLIGRPARTFKQFVADYAQAWQISLA